MTQSDAATSAATAIGLKALGAAGIFSAGVLGAVMIAAFEPPATKHGMFAQAAVAGTTSLMFGPAVMHLVEHYINWVTWSTLGAQDYLEYAAPVYLLVGAMSWGVFGALAKLRSLIASRGADVIADRVGLEKKD